MSSGDMFNKMKLNTAQCKLIIVSGWYQWANSAKLSIFAVLLYISIRFLFWHKIPYNKMSC